MTIKRLIFLLALLTACLRPGHAAPTTFTDDEYRFSATLPDGWSRTKPAAGQNNLILHAQKAARTLRVYAFRAGKDHVYEFGSLVDDKNFPAGAAFIGTTDDEPFWNLLRHSATRTYCTPDGQYVRQLRTMRARTQFVVYAESPDGDFSEFEPLLGSIDLGRTLKGNFLLAKTNLGSLAGTVLLLLFPALGWQWGHQLRKWRDSCRTDRRALWRLAGYSAVSGLFFALIFVTLHEDLRLAAAIGGFAALFWGMFASGSKFFQSLYDGLFE